MGFNCYLNLKSRHPIKIISLENARLFKTVAKKGFVKPLHFNIASGENFMFKGKENRF